MKGRYLLVGLALAACGSSNEPQPLVPTTGTLRITTSTAGNDPDPDGYALLIDTLTPVPIGSNTTAQLVTVAPGTYQVLLTGIAANCVLAVPTPVDVAAGQSVNVALNVGCTPILVDLRVTTVSSGEDIDHSGYVVTVDGQPTLPVPASGQVVVRAPNGSRTIGLAERASNCAITSGPPGSVELPLGVTTDVQFSLACVHTPKIAITLTGGTYSVNPDGTGFSRIGPGVFPDWSPDGRRILTHFQQDIYMVNADSTDAHQVQLGGRTVAGSAAWSPDGSRLAVSLRVAPDTFSVFVCDTNGANLRRITDGATSDVDPSWSPSGDKVVFARGENLFLANADGSGVSQIPNGTGRTPHWSPDGSRILFIAWSGAPDFTYRAYLINPDGSNRVLLQPQASGQFDVVANWADHGSKALVIQGQGKFLIDVATGQVASTLILPGGPAAWRD